MLLVSDQTCSLDLGYKTCSTLQPYQPYQTQNMSSATDLNNSGSKRVRLTKDAPPAPSTAPSSAAADRVVSAIASLPSSTKQFAEHWCKKINTLHAKLQRQTKTLATLTANPNFIPRSARINFQLTGSQLATEHADFKAQVDATKELVAKFQLDLKEHIVAAAKVELGLSQKEKQTATTAAIIAFGKIYLLATPGSPVTPSLLSIYVHQIFTKSIFKNNLLPVTDPTIHSLFTELSEFATFETVTQQDFEALTQSEGTRFNTFKTHCYELFVAPCTAYDEAEHRNTVTQSVTNYAEFTIGNTTTAATAMAIDTEPTVPAAQLTSLINAAVKDALRKQQNNPKAPKEKNNSKAAAKNEVRGATPSASLKKKKASQAATRKTTPRTTPNTPIGTVPRAAAAANASTTETPRSTGRKQSNQKNVSKNGTSRSKKN